MKLSVCCITYNQEKYIAEAIESMLAQQTNFDFEIVIGEDGSTDATRNICEKYSQKYPPKIKLLHSAGNLGMNPNLERTLKACSGEYVALCEGDDYWIDKNKLQKQVDFLEANPSFAICYHRVYELYRNNKLKLEEINTDETEKEYTIEYLAKGNCMHTASVVFRNGLINKFPSWFNKSPVGDYVLHMLNAVHGKIKYLPVPMAVYRKHHGGVWSLKDVNELRKKWVTVIDLLLRENLTPVIVNKLQLQKKEIITDYLIDLFFRDEALFKNELAKSIAENSQIAEEWLLIHYPRITSRLRSEFVNSRTYRLGNSLIKPLRQIKKQFSFLSKH